MLHAYYVGKDMYSLLLYRLSFIESFQVKTQEVDGYFWYIHKYARIQFRKFTVNKFSLVV